MQATNLLLSLYISNSEHLLPLFLRTYLILWHGQKPKERDGKLLVGFPSNKVILFNATL